MSVPVSQMWTVATHILSQKLRGNRQYPLVLMLEPLFRCNLACAGCGKIQYPPHILRRQLTPEQCFAAARECQAPVVSLPGGEPLMHPQIGEIAAGLMDMNRYVYLCTNGLLLEEKLAQGVFKPSKYLTFAVHLDGLREVHDFAVCREGTYERAVRGIRAALDAGFRVTTNTTLFEGADLERCRQFFDAIMDMGVEAMTVSPGYSYQKAPDQEHFLKRQTSAEVFRQLFARRKRTWRFNQSPLFLDFLMGYIDFECTPWGNPTYCVFGWQRPCYLLQDGYARTFRELLEDTDWDSYGRRSGNPKCKDCLVHSGYEPSSVDYTFGSPLGLLRTAWSVLSGRSLGSAERPLVVPANRPGRRAAMEPGTEVTTDQALAAEPTDQGWDAAGGSAEQLRAAVEKAVDFRGDVTITTRDGQQVTGYVFSRVTQDARDPYLEYYPKGADEKRSLRYAQIARLVFTGRDAAAGRSWEAWVRRYQEQQKARAAGQTVAAIEPPLMPLEDE